MLEKLRKQKWSLYEGQPLRTQPWHSRLAAGSPEPDFQQPKRDIENFCLHVWKPIGVCWLCALHLPATEMALSFRCPLHQGPSSSPKGTRKKQGVFSV